MSTKIIETVIIQALPGFLESKGIKSPKVTGYQEKQYCEEVEVEIYYEDRYLDFHTYTYYGTLGSLILEIDK